MYPSDLRETTARLNINEVLTIQREQRLFPDITFTCNGSITKWIVGAGGDIDSGERHNSQIQLWRRGASNDYHRVGASILTLNQTSHPDVHEYTPNPPLEFQEGDILGVYQPNNDDNVLQLYYQEYTGPFNYLMTYNTNPPPPSSLALVTPTTQLYYPLVSVIVSTSGMYNLLC